MNKTMKLAVAVAGAITLGACNGWPEAPDHAAAMTAPEKYPTYTAADAQEVPTFTAEHHRYMVMPTEVELRVARTRSIGAAGGANVFSLEGDDAPYANLFAQAPDGSWRAAAVID